MDRLKGYNCTLLLNTCDAYSDCWEGFFKLLKIQWPEFQMKVVLNTESLDFQYEGLDINSFRLDSNSKLPWGKRLIETLKRIDTKYVLFALEDFWLESPVDVQGFHRCYEYMENNQNIACFSFFPTEDQNNVKSRDYTGFEKRPQKGEYRLNCQIALWNREKLISYIRPHESPWEWELWGSKRSSRYQEEFYSISHDAPKIFDYRKGEIIMRGRWYMDRVLPLCEQYEIKVDFSKRPTYEEWREVPKERKRKLIRGIKNRFNIIKSLI